jgi:hypothetical protein
LAVNYRFYSSCKNQTQLKIVIQNVMVQHDFLSVAREASAAPGASFKWRIVPFRDFREKTTPLAELSPLLGKRGSAAGRFALK